MLKAMIPSLVSLVLPNLTTQPSQGQDTWTLTENETQKMKTMMRKYRILVWVRPRRTGKTTIQTVAESLLQFPNPRPIHPALQAIQKKAMEQEIELQRIVRNLLLTPWEETVIRANLTTIQALAQTSQRTTTEIAERLLETGIFPNPTQLTVTTSSVTELRMEERTVVKKPEENLDDLIKRLPQNQTESEMRADQKRARESRAKARGELPLRQTSTAMFPSLGKFLGKHSLMSRPKMRGKSRKG
jgi:hypothetical protein